MIRKGDLRKARVSVVREAKREFPGQKARDTTGPSIEAGLVVVNFDVYDTIMYCRDQARLNEHRISIANDELQIKLFGAAIASGIIIGARAERMRK